MYGSVAVVGVKESLDSDARVEFTRDKLNPFANLAILTRSTLFMLIGLTVVFNVRAVLCCAVLRCVVPCR